MREIIIGAITNEEGVPIPSMNDNGILQRINPDSPNAKLIAAAPDLLESLKHLMANGGLIKVVEESHSDSLLRKSFDNCLNAIKKATI